jgi:hypothetical protein
MAGEAVDQSLLHLLPQIHALFSDPLRVVMMGSAPAIPPTPSIPWREVKLLRRFLRLRVVDDILTWILRVLII